MAHEDLGDTTRHVRTCNWWIGAPGIEGAAYEREVTGELRYRDCTCSLRWREMVRTEREMHAAWRKRAEEAEAALSDPKAVAAEQAEDEGLWFQPVYASEACLQTALRRLTAAVEGKSPEQCARAVLD